MSAEVIDTDISRWILEFLLRQQLEDRILDSLLHVLPLPDNIPSLKKSLLLRKLESEISNGTVSEKILEILEQIEELDHQEGIRHGLNLIKAAYCSVAVDCTVRCLKNDNNNVRGEYFDAVKRIWRGRVSRMEKFGDIGLVSEELLEWKDDIEAAVFEDSVCEKVVKRSEEIDAVAAVRFYLKDEKERMEPSFIELVAEKLKAEGDDAVWGLIGLGKREEGDHATGKAASLPSSAHNAGDVNSNIEVHKANVLPRRKHVARKSTRVISRPSKGAKIFDNHELGAGPSCNKSNVLATPDIHKVQEALKSSRLELQALVKDPLPDALQLADTVINSLADKNKDHETVAENQRGNLENKDHETVAENQRGNPSMADSAGVYQASADNSRGAHATGGKVGNGSSSPQMIAPKPSLMERNKTAHTYEWDDSINGSPEELPNSNRTLQLPSPRRRPVSPLKKYEVVKFTKRRKIKKWSTVEEDTLRTGVQKFGKGNWKLILYTYRHIFEERTEVDLKDKWRNMTKYG